MNTRIIRRVIVVTMLLELLWLVILPAGNRLASRRPAMVQAVRAFETNPSPTTKAAMWEQVHQDDLYNWHRKEALFGLMLVANVVAIYFFWNYGVKKTTA